MVGIGAGEGGSATGGSHAQLRRDATTVDQYEGSAGLQRIGTGGSLSTSPRLGERSSLFCGRAMLRSRFRWGLDPLTLTDPLLVEDILEGRQYFSRLVCLTEAPVCDSQM